MYEKQTWTNGDVITAEKLNHIEDGIANAGGGSGVAMATLRSNYGVMELSMRWREVRDYVENGTLVYVFFPLSGAVFLAVEVSSFSDYIVRFTGPDPEPMILTCDDEDSYPVMRSSD